MGLSLSFSWDEGNFCESFRWGGSLGGGGGGIGGTGFGIGGGGSPARGGGDFSDRGSFDKAFAAAHEQLGAGRTFDFQGKSYTTDRADGRDLHAEHAAGGASVAASALGGGLGGGDFSDRGSFDKAFAAAHEQLGAGRTFDFQGKSYTTDRADGRDLHAEHAATTQPATAAPPPTTGGGGDGPVPTLRADTSATTKAAAAAAAAAAPAAPKTTSLPASSAPSTVPAAQRNALQAHKADIKQAAQRHNLPSDLVAAIIMKESESGTSPYLNGAGYGDNDKAFGVMQVDRQNKPVGTHNIWSAQHLDQGCRILKESMDAVAKDHPDWPNDKKQQGGAAAYNMGAKNVKTLEGIDVGTTHNSYGADVMHNAEVVRVNKLLE